MSKSLESRLDGSKGDFLKDVELYGQNEALSRWRDRLDGYHDIIGLQRFLIKERQSPDLGIRSILGSSSDISVADDLLNAVLRKFHAMDAEKQVLLKQIHQLEAEVDYHRTQKALSAEPRVREIMALCQKS